MTIMGTLLSKNSVVKRSVEKKAKSSFGQNFDGVCEDTEV